MDDQPEGTPPKRVVGVPFKRADEGGDDRRAPGGRPKGYLPFAPMLRNALMKTDRRNRSQMEKIAEKVVAMAVAGDMDAIRWLSDRVDGKVAQQLNVANEHTVAVVPWLPFEGAKEEGDPRVPELTGVSEVSEGAGGDTER